MANKKNNAFSSAVNKNQLILLQQIESICPYYKSPAVTHSLINDENILEMVLNPSNAAHTKIDSPGVNFRIDFSFQKILYNSVF
jgi:hypothetical protein